MASRRRRRKSIGKVIVDVERRVRRVEKRPGAKRLKTNVVTTEKLGYRAVTTKVIQVDAVATENIATDAVTANEAAFGVIVVTDTEPTVYLKDGTTWVNPDDGATSVYSADLEGFVTVTDATAQLTADGKNTIYSQTTAPAGSAHAVDDLWLDTDDGNKLYRWTGSAWVSAQDTAIAAAAEAAALAQAAADTGAAAAEVAQNTADGKNKVYRQTTVPTGETHAVGDTWFDTDGDNAIYRYALGATGTVSKKALTGNVATLTTSAAHSFTPGESIVVTSVDATFNGTYTVTAAPTSTTLTYAKTASNVAEIASSGAINSSAGWKALVLGSNAISRISATQISTGTLAAGVVYAGSLNANQISTGTIASNIVYAGTVNANQINAGTLTAGVVYAGSISTSQMTAGTLTAGTIYTGAIAASQITAGTITAAISITSPTITGGTITASTFTSTNYNSSNGIGIISNSGIDSIYFSNASNTVASLTGVASGFTITGPGGSSIAMPSNGSISFASSGNIIVLGATARLDFGSGGGTSGFNGLLRNTWAALAGPSGGSPGDVWLTYT